MFYVLVLLVMSAIISSIITKFEIPILREKAGQNIREDGPQSHLSKAGTPSMGGIAMIIAAFAVSIIGGIFFQANMVEVLLIDLVFVGFGCVGFIDDYRKVIKKVNEGLKPKEKMALLIIISAALAIALYVYEGGQVWIPFVKTYVDFGIFYIPFIIFVAIAMTNAVNLTDGLDGLASGATALTTMFFTIAGMMYGVYSGAYFCAALCGACLGFLVWNKNPAKVFMGDTGSLALGGGLAAAAIVMKLEFMLVIVGLLYVCEALSVVLQVSYFKATGGKRIFKMAPIHHHFEKCGYSEIQVVIAFWTFTLLCCIVGFVMI